MLTSDNGNTITIRLRIGVFHAYLKEKHGKKIQVQSATCMYSAQQYTTGVVQSCNVIHHFAITEVAPLNTQNNELLILINFLPGVLTITITDNGKGFDFTLQDINENPNFGLGLRNMQSRAQLVSAQFNLPVSPE
jgi:signal transduction histidine kinase